jgi:proteinaceous RNase P
MQDEVLTKLREDDGPSLHVYCHVSGGLVFGTAGWRYAIFQRELPLVLETFRYGDRALFATHPSNEIQWKDR